MNPTARRGALLLLAVVGLWVGGWAYIAPGAWYRSFPGPGHHWLPPLGPGNQHLASDVGALDTALAVLSLAAARRPLDRSLGRAAGAARLVFGTLHLGYHLRHMDRYQGADLVLNVPAPTLVPAVALLPLLRVPPRGPSLQEPGGAESRSRSRP